MTGAGYAIVGKRYTGFAKNQLDAMPLMELQPVLHGPRLYLRPLKAADFDALFAAASDPLIWEQHPAPNRHERKIFEQFFNRALDSRGALAVVDKTTQKIVGTSRYYDVEGSVKSPTARPIRPLSSRSAGPSPTA